MNTYEIPLELQPQGDSALPFAIHFSFFRRQNIVKSILKVGGKWLLFCFDVLARTRSTVRLCQGGPQHFKSLLHSPLAGSAPRRSSDPIPVCHVPKQQISDTAISTRSKCPQSWSNQRFSELRTIRKLQTLWSNESFVVPSVVFIRGIHEHSASVADVAGLIGPRYWTCM